MCRTPLDHTSPKMKLLCTACLLVGIAYDMFLGASYEGSYCCPRFSRVPKVEGVERVEGVPLRTCPCSMSAECWILCSETSYKLAGLGCLLSNMSIAEAQLCIYQRCLLGLSACETLAIVLLACAQLCDIE